MRWNFFLRSSFSPLRSPETQRTPSSTVTLTSSFFISGRSALRRYPRSSSVISTSGDQSATVRLWVSPVPILFGNPPRKRLKRFCVASSISLVFMLSLPFWADLTPSPSPHAHRLLSDSTLILCSTPDRYRDGAGARPPAIDESDIGVRGRGSRKRSEERKG